MFLIEILLYLTGLIEFQITNLTFDLLLTSWLKLKSMLPEYPTRPIVYGLD